MRVKIKTVETDLNCFDIFSLFKDEKDIIFLDSAKDENNLGQYSIIGLNPYLKFKSKNNLCTVNDESFEDDSFTELNKILREYKIENNTNLPFISGAIGYFSYDLGRQIEELPENAVEDVFIPDAYFNFYDNIIIYDNLNENLFITALGILNGQEESINFIEEKIKLGEKREKLNLSNLSYDIETFKSNFKEDEYLNTVSTVKEYIKNGDIYITNLTQRYSKEIKEKPFNIYEKLRSINPAPFAAYMALEDFYILSSSPERFLKIENRVMETRPIKGTRPRGKNIREDERYKTELLQSEKDKSELLMIVDLERNDLSKVCKPNTVKVTELFKLEEYSTVFHLVSTVIGEIKDEYSTIDCIKACFPGGSITGAPKIRSMEIIDELEKVRRNIYTGAIGYIGLEGNADLNIVIRTALIKDNKAYFGVGGGITYESVEQMEYDETLDKARALMKVLK